MALANNPVASELPNRTANSSSLLVSSNFAERGTAMTFNAVAVVVFLLTLSVIAVGQTQSEDQAVRDFIDNWCAAFVQHDTDTMVDHYLDSPGTQLIVSGGDQYSGFAAITEIYKQSFEEVEFASVRMQDLTIAVAGNTAFVTGKFSAETRVRDIDQSYMTQCRTSLSLARVGEDWKIVGEHSSPLPGVERIARIKRDDN
jgi:ketosteroid isomerase-like protein